MEVVFQKSFDSREKADVLVIPCWKKEGVPEIAAGYGGYKQKINSIMDLGDFSAKENEICLLYDTDHLEQRLLLIGLGNEDSCSAEVLRRGYAETIKLAQTKKWKNVNVLLPTLSEHSPQEVASYIIDSVLLANYTFDFGIKAEKKGALVDKVTLVSDVCLSGQELQELIVIGKGVKLTRDLVNGNADEITPRRLADEALGLAKKYSSLQVKVFDKEAIQKMGMGLFYAVARGAAQDPYFITISYQGAKNSQDHTVLIGKGITYDTGGLSLKPSASMDTMKCDMAGAATVLGVMLSVAELKLPINISCVIAATENAIGSRSYKLGDIYRGYNQTTVEIKNTDAEGRLALADCLSYAIDKLNPTRMIDLATLTGAAVVAFGDHRSPVFSNHTALASQLFEAGEEVGERLWLMPLDQDYRELIVSKIADLKNSGSRDGSLMFSAMFLKEFAGNIPWAHLDIAGTAFLEKPRHYHTTCATGYGVRLLMQFLKRLYETSM